MISIRLHYHKQLAALFSDPFIVFSQYMHVIAAYGTSYVADNPEHCLSVNAAVEIHIVFPAGIYGKIRKSHSFSQFHNQSS